MYAAVDRTRPRVHVRRVIIVVDRRMESLGNFPRVSFFFKHLIAMSAAKASLGLNNCGSLLSRSFGQGIHNVLVMYQFVRVREEKKQHDTRIWLNSNIVLVTKKIKFRQVHL